MITVFYKACVELFDDALGLTQGVNILFAILSHCSSNLCPFFYSFLLIKVSLKLKYYWWIFARYIK